MNKPIKYETERLFLKPTSEEDAPFILELMNTPKWMKYIGDRNVKTVVAARNYILKKMKPQQERLGYSNYTVIRKSDGVKMGSCGLYDREGMEGIDIGFSLLPDYEKKGYAFEAANKMMDLAANDFGISIVKGITSKENFASQKLLEKLGLTLTGTTILPGDDEEILVYAIDLKK